MPVKECFIALGLVALASPVSSQSAKTVDCTEPANARLAECVSDILPVPRLATNAAPLLAVPLGLLALGGLGGGGGGGGTPSTTGTISE